MTKPKAVPTSQLIGEADGDHLVLWYRTAAVRARVVIEYLNCGDPDRDIYAIILPFREIQSVETSLAREGFPVERLMRQGRLHIFASEEILPDAEGGLSRLGETLGMLKAKAEAEGRGLRLVGRVAPVLFERGDVKGAMRVEEMADAGLGDAKLLCLYDGSKLADVPASHARQVDDAHAVVVYEEPGGRVRKTKSGRGSRAHPREPKR